jgi:hypothetical protein
MTNITSTLQLMKIKLLNSILKLILFTNTKKDEYKKFSFSFNNDLLEALINTYVHRISSQIIMYCHTINK